MFIFLSYLDITRQPPHQVLTFLDSNEQTNVLLCHTKHNWDRPSVAFDLHPYNNSSLPQMQQDMDYSNTLWNRLLSLSDSILPFYFNYTLTFFNEACEQLQQYMRILLSLLWAQCRQPSPMLRYHLQQSQRHRMGIANWTCIGRYHQCYRCGFKA